MEEGIIHLQKQMQELRYEEALGLLEDVMMGMASIEDAIQPMMSELVENNIEITGATLKENISRAVNIYKGGKEAELEKQVEEGILVAFKKWKQEIVQVLRPYVVS